MREKRVLWDIPDELKPLKILVDSSCSFGSTPPSPLEEYLNDQRDEQEPLYEEWERFRTSTFYP